MGEEGHDAGTAQPASRSFVSVAYFADRLRIGWRAIEVAEF